MLLTNNFKFFGTIFKKAVVLNFLVVKNQIFYKNAIAYILKFIKGSTAKVSLQIFCFYKNTHTAIPIYYVLKA